MDHAQLIMFGAIAAIVVVCVAVGAFIAHRGAAKAGSDVSAAASAVEGKIDALHDKVDQLLPK
jgi:hypothetical protein